jgi:hypothetical protein
MMARAKAAVQVLDREWVPGNDAAGRLQKSERSLLRLANAGHVRWKLEEGTRQRVYHAGDLEKVIEEGIRAVREEPSRRTGIALASRAGTPLAIAPEASALMRELVDRFLATRDRVAVTEKLWLTLEEAGAYSGLGRNDLLNLCQTATLIARKSGGWRILRTSLEAFDGSAAPGKAMAARR